MNEHSGKRFPIPSPETQPYWDACREHELRIQQCQDCQHYQFYPRIICTDCSGRNLTWVVSTGKAVVLSYTIITRAVSEAYKADVPYVVALIKLDEGPTMMSNIVECDHEELDVGLSLEVIFEDWSEEISIPKFRPNKK